MDRNDIFIEFRYNVREIDGVEEFISDLKKSYLVQAKPEWIPACSEGGEAWIEILINSSFFDFAKDVIIYGLAWDMLKKGSKKYLLKPLFKALATLEQSNEQSWKLKVMSMKFQFDDVDIIIGGINPNSFSVVSTVFNEIAKHCPQIESKTEMRINKIETPISEHSPYSLNIDENLELSEYIKRWKIELGYGVEHKIYILKDCSLLDA